ncbi:MAG: type IV pilus assembly protein PilM [Candidatus Omnitrophica bacterium]|nr:type IV pilus assembly protein PilM [Candidatus Omnitrophota bacterium]
MNWLAPLHQYLNFINRFLPKSRLTAVVGIDIGTSSVKAVEIARTNNSFEIHRWALESIEGTDTKAAVKRLFSRMNIKDQTPVTSVAGKGALIRYIDMPRMTPEELRKSFVYEIDKYFPFDPQTIYTDCYITDPQSKEKKMSVLVAAAKKELVDERIQLFKEVGMNLTYVTTDAIAMANAFEQLVTDETTPTAAKAILDIGGMVSSLMILKDHSPCFTRDIFIGSQEMSKQIANILGVDLAKAEEIKRAPAEMFNEVIQACEAPLDNLIGEIHLSLDYFMTEKNVQVAELFLVGGGSLLKGIEGVFEKSLNIPVKIWNPLAGLRLGAEMASSDIHLFSSQLGVAIGLALTQV